MATALSVVIVAIVWLFKRRRWGGPPAQTGAGGRGTSSRRRYAPAMAWQQYRERLGGFGNAGYASRTIATPSGGQRILTSTSSAVGGKPTSASCSV